MYPIHCAHHLNPDLPSWWSPSWRWGHGVWGVLSYLSEVIRPAGGATIDICSVWSVGCRFPQLSPAFPPSCTESRLKPTIDLGSILRDLGDLHAVWSLLFLLPNLRWFLWFLSFLTHFFAPFGLLAPLCKCSSAQLICSCLQFTCMSLSGTSTFASDFYFSLSDCSKSLNSTTSTQTQPWIRTVLSEEEAYG